LENVERLAGRPRQIALQTRDLAGRFVYLDAVLHIPHPAHRPYAADELPDFIGEYRPAQSHPSLRCSNFNGRRVAHEKPEAGSNSLLQRPIVGFLTENESSRLGHDSGRPVSDVARCYRSRSSRLGSQTYELIARKRAPSSTDLRIQNVHRQ
jgi:hypothetical protein